MRSAEVVRMHGRVYVYELADERTVASKHEDCWYVYGMVWYGMVLCDVPV